MEQPQTDGRQTNTPGIGTFEFDSAEDCVQYDSYTYQQQQQEQPAPKNPMTVAYIQQYLQDPNISDIDDLLKNIMETNRVPNQVLSTNDSLYVEQKPVYQNTSCQDVVLDGILNGITNNQNDCRSFHEKEVTMLVDDTTAQDAWYTVLKSEELPNSFNVVYQNFCSPNTEARESNCVFYAEQKPVTDDFFKGESDIVKEMSQREGNLSEDCNDLTSSFNVCGGAFELELLDQQEVEELCQYEEDNVDDMDWDMDNNTSNVHYYDGVSVNVNEGAVSLDEILLPVPAETFSNIPEMNLFEIETVEEPLPESVPNLSIFRQPDTEANNENYQYIEKVQLFKTFCPSASYNRLVLKDYFGILLHNFEFRDIVSFCNANGDASLTPTNFVKVHNHAGLGFMWNQLKGNSKETNYYENLKRAIRLNVKRGNGDFVQHNRHFIIGLGERSVT